MTLTTTKTTVERRAESERRRKVARNRPHPARSFRPTLVRVRTSLARGLKTSTTSGPGMATFDAPSTKSGPNSANVGHLARWKDGLAPNICFAPANLSSFEAAPKLLPSCAYVAQQLLKSCSRTRVWFPSRPRSPYSGQPRPTPARFGQHGSSLADAWS